MIIQPDDSIQKYSTKNVCEKVGCKEHNLRYLLKQTGLQIEKDEFGNRWFSEADIEQIREIIKHKKNGIPLKIVSEQLNHGVNQEPADDSQLILINQLQPLIIRMIDQFNANLEIAVTSQTESITNQLKEVGRDNKDLKKIVSGLEKNLIENQEKHFKYVDERLHQIMESNRKRGFWGRLFRK